MCVVQAQCGYIRATTIATCLAMFRKFPMVIYDMIIILYKWIFLQCAFVVYENWKLKIMILDLGGNWCAYGSSCAPIGGVFAWVN